MNARTYEPRQHRARRLLCAALLLVGGCTAPGTRERLASLEWVGGGGRGVPSALAEPDLYRGWRLSMRLGTPAKASDARYALPQTEESPAPGRVAAAVGGPRRISVHVVRTPARTFFESLVSQDPSVNMVVHPEVKDEISVELKNVTVDEVVEIVCEMYPLDCQPFVGRTPNGARGYKIFPWQLTTRTYPVDFLSVVRGGYSETLVSSGNEREITTTRNNKEQGNNITSTPSVPGSGMRTEYKSDFWMDLEESINAILQLGLVVSRVTEELDERGKASKKVTRVRKGSYQPGITEKRIKYKKSGKVIETERWPGTSDKSQEAHAPAEEEETDLFPTEKGVVINRQAGLLTVRAYPREHQEIAFFLEQLRNRSQRQVILEAKILEVSLNDGAQFGIDWLAIRRGIGGTMPPLRSEPQGGDTFSSRDVVSTDSPTGLVARVSKGLLVSRAAGADQPINLALRTHDFIGFVHLLQQQGTVQVLSSPRISTVNNQKAMIKVGSDEFFITGMRSGNIIGFGSDRAVTPPMPTIESMFTGISLDVTPQIGEGDMVTLHIHPMVTEVQDKMKQFVVDDKPQSLPLAFSQTRETDSIIRVRNGDVAVIGGLMKNSVKERSDRLPGLGSVPVLGTLFGHEEKKGEKSELVILLRPVVVDSRQDWDGHVVRASEQLRTLVQPPP
ncbi:MAG: pilus (MSHA type) biogenesis protein MshL [Magnetococcales bacterium]|nr:pilus (MSHA type) biogenesis protein MshL [Magnetococcales bacterium]